VHLDLTAFSRPSEELSILMRHPEERVAAGRRALTRLVSASLFQMTRNLVAVAKGASSINEFPGSAGATAAANMRNRMCGHSAIGQVESPLLIMPQLLGNEHDAR
jgi:hypothetical protein